MLLHFHHLVEADVQQAIGSEHRHEDAATQAESEQRQGQP